MNRFHVVPNDFLSRLLTNNEARVYYLKIQVDPLHFGQRDGLRTFTGSVLRQKESVILYAFLEGNKTTTGTSYAKVLKKLLDVGVKNVA